MATEITDIKSILLVEDDPQDAELTLAALDQTNLAKNVAVVSDGEMAQDYLFYRGEFKDRTAGNPILMILDLHMPKVSGLDLLKIVKTNDDLSAIPIVVLSSSREMLDLVECYKHGVNAYVVKPLDFAEFMHTVKQLAIFWASINEPPPHSRIVVTEIQMSKAALTGKEGDNNEISAPYLALGGRPE